MKNLVTVPKIFFSNIDLKPSPKYSAVGSF